MQVKLSDTLLFLKIYYLFMYFWLHWVFFAAHGLFLAAGSGGYGAWASLIAEHELYVHGLQ